jgi:putative membrane protein
MLMMTLSSLLWIALIAVLIWAVVRWLNKQNIHTTTPTPSAMEILRQRYARGEIDAATFEQMRERLEAHEQEPFAQSHGSRGDVR